MPILAILTLSICLYVGISLCLATVILTRRRVLASCRPWDLRQYGLIELLRSRRWWHRVILLCWRLVRLLVGVRKYSTSWLWDIWIFIEYLLMKYFVRLIQLLCSGLSLMFSRLDWRRYSCSSKWNKRYWKYNVSSLRIKKEVSLNTMIDDISNSSVATSIDSDTADISETIFSQTQMKGKC